MGVSVVGEITMRNADLATAEKVVELLERLFDKGNVEMTDLGNSLLIEVSSKKTRWPKTCESTLARIAKLAGHCISDAELKFHAWPHEFWRWVWKDGIFHYQEGHIFYSEGVG